MTTSSPVSVIPVEAPRHEVMEELALLEEEEEEETSFKCLSEDPTTEDPPPARPSSISKPWSTCPASAKSVRTINPIRALVDPIVANGIKTGEERGDGKDLISLAVSSAM